MNNEIFRKIGLTEGEIRVYDSLVKIGKSSTGAIMESSGISSSKVYLILEKLIQKGLVSFIIENNVKKFQVANPKTILEYIDKKKDEIDDIKRESVDLVKEITDKLGTYKQESAQIYTGFAGMKAAFQNLLDDLKKGDEALIFGVEPREHTEKVENFLVQWHNKRADRGISAKSVLSQGFRSRVAVIRSRRRLYESRFYKLKIPVSMTIGNKRCIITILEEPPLVIEIISDRFVERYKKFFYQVWDKTTAN